MINRRQWLRGLGLALGASAQTGSTHAFAQPVPQANPQESRSSGRLALADYEPRSMLQVRETHLTPPDPWSRPNQSMDSAGRLDLHAI